MEIKLSMCDAEREARLEVQNEVTFKTGYNFLLAHRGYRQGCIHTILGPSGGGKSTLVRSLLVDVAHNLNGRNAGLILSEQTVDSFKNELANLPKLPSEIDSVKIYSECDKNIREFIVKRGWSNVVNAFIEKHNLSILFIDNMTSSDFFTGNGQHGSQNSILQELKNIATEKGIPIVLIWHTKKGIDDDYEQSIKSDDVKYSGKITIISEFFYIMQRFHINGKIFPTLRIVKHRGQPVKDRIFFLNYNEKFMMYSSDRAISSEQFHELFAERREARNVKKKKDSYSSHNKGF